MKIRALICGISGQDGAYLARLLLGKGYEVVGTSRDAHSSSFLNLDTLGIRDQVKLASMAPNDFRSVISTLREFMPDEVYNLAGQSSVGLSFNQPAETMESIATATLNLLEGIRFISGDIKLYSAGSGECFGDTGATAATESTPFAPQSPYAVAKVTAHYLVATYRKAYGLHACTGILFNHESPIRSERFVTQKIIKAAARVARGEKIRLQLGNIDIVRDWGWAPEYVEAMWLMLQQPSAEDYIIATGCSFQLRDFVDHAFTRLGLDWREHVDADPALIRPADHRVARADPSAALRDLGWKARYSMPDIVGLMLDVGAEITEHDDNIQTRHAS